MAEKTKVRDWMTPNPVTIDAGATIVEAIHLLKERGFRRLPVMKSGKLVGIVTERMLLTFTPGKSTSLDTWELHYLLARTPVTEAMNPKPHTDDDAVGHHEGAHDLRRHALGEVRAEPAARDGGHRHHARLRHAHRAD